MPLHASLSSLPASNASRPPLSFLTPSSNPALVYFRAAVLMLLMFLLRASLTPLVGKQFPYATLYPGIVLIAAIDGWRPALFSTLFGFGLSELFLLHDHDFIPNTVSGRVGMCIFFTNCALAIALAEAQHKATRRALAHAQEAENESAERKQAESALRVSHNEIEGLNGRLRLAMRETHHRVKNNLQVIAALADVQRDTVSGSVPVSALDRIGQHARNLAVMHDLLTQGVSVDAEINEVELKAVIDKLLPLLNATAGTRRIHSRIEVDGVRLPIKESASLTLLISELVSNAVKHGRGDIGLDLTAEAANIRLIVRDDGDGFPSGFDATLSANTGLDLIDSLTRYDLQGTAHYENVAQGGAQVTITFPLPAPAASLPHVSSRPTLSPPTRAVVTAAGASPLTSPAFGSPSVAAKVSTPPVR